MKADAQIEPTRIPTVARVFIGEPGGANGMADKPDCQPQSARLGEPSALFSCVSKQLVLLDTVRRDGPSIAVGQSTMSAKPD